VSEPELSVVLVTRDTARTLRPIVASLAAQTVADRVELVIVAPDEQAGALPRGDVARFHSVRVVGVGAVTERGRAAAHGIPAAGSAIVALCENHCFPEPLWAERTIERHRDGWAAVGPAIRNANPESLTSQALHAFGYGRFPEARPPGTATELPLHNTAYRKAALPPTVAELEGCLMDEPGLQARLSARNALFFDSSAVKWHLNEATAGLLAGLVYASGRRYGGERSRQWPSWKRAAYAALAPILSLPIARDVWGKLSPDGDVRKGPALALVVWSVGLLHALGEAVSYVRGPRSPSSFTESEEFFIRERLGGRPIGKVEIARFVALLDRADDGSNG
jgi:hypothetical protein